MSIIYDAVLGREEAVQDEVTPENEKEIILKDITPEIDVEVEDEDEM